MVLAVGRRVGAASATRCGSLETSLSGAAQPIRQGPVRRRPGVTIEGKQSLPWVNEPFFPEPVETAVVRTRLLCHLGLNRRLRRLSRQHGDWTGADWFGRVPPPCRVGIDGLALHQE
jgi:hypothetical protein